MLGISDCITSSFTERIAEIAIEPHNLSDGGFLASKIISEFGIIGVFILIFYIFYLIKFIFNGNKTWQKIQFEASS